MDLVKDDLKLLRWHLVNDHECISKSEMEDADKLKIVDRMVECFSIRRSCEDHCGHPEEDEPE